MSDRDSKTKKPAARPKKAVRSEPARANAPQAPAIDKAAASPKPRAAGKVTSAAAVGKKAPLASANSGATPRGSEALPAKPATKPATKSRASAKRRAKSSAAMKQARFAVGDVVRHRFYPFRGVVFDIDPVFANTEEWWQAIPEEIRPDKDQPFYHLLAENAETEYVAYVSEQNLIADQTGKPLRHPRVAEMFELDDDGSYRAVFLSRH